MLNVLIKAAFVCFGLLLWSNLDPVNAQTGDCKSFDFNPAREYQTGARMPIHLPQPILTTMEIPAS